MTRTIEDWVCELIPGIWLAEDKVLMPNDPLMGKCNIADKAELKREQKK